MKLTMRAHDFTNPLLSISAFDPNTDAIVGAAHDAFDPDVIVDEFN